MVSLGGCGGVHTLALSQATRLAMVHERAAPWRTPQSKEVVQSPKGVFVIMEMLARDSAIHYHPLGITKGRETQDCKWEELQFRGESIEVFFFVLVYMGEESVLR